MSQAYSMILLLKAISLTCIVVCSTGLLERHWYRVLEYFYVEYQYLSWKYEIAVQYALEILYQYSVNCLLHISVTIQQTSCQ